MAKTGSNRAQQLREQTRTDAFAPQSTDAFGSAEQPVMLYQTSTMAALLAGIYDGDLTIAELLTHGDFSLGSFNHLDGEMVVLDGTCYHLHADGSCTIASGQDKTPFAAVLWFRPDKTITITDPSDRAALTGLIDSAIPSPNLTYALRVTGSFASVRTRTVRAQRPPYPPLTEATAHELVTDFQHVTGTLTGFRTPAYEQGISVAGYHLHFLTQDRHHGGHVLDFALHQGEVTICTASEVHLSCPAQHRSCPPTCRQPTRMRKSSTPKVTDAFSRKVLNLDPRKGCRLVMV